MIRLWGKRLTYSWARRQLEKTLYEVRLADKLKVYSIKYSLTKTFWLVVGLVRILRQPQTRNVSNFKYYDCDHCRYVNSENLWSLKCRNVYKLSFVNDTRLRIATNRKYSRSYALLQDLLCEPLTLIGSPEMQDFYRSSTTLTCQIFAPRDQHSCYWDRGERSDSNHWWRELITPYFNSTRPRPVNRWPSHGTPRQMQFWQTCF